MERADVCHKFYIASDVINSVVFILGIVTRSAFYTGSKDQRTIFIAVVIFYAIATALGFYARWGLKNKNNRFWPHLVYIFVSYAFLGCSIGHFVASSSSTGNIFIGISAVNFIVAIITAIFGMVVHNDA